MRTTEKIALGVGVGLTTSALLATWLLTGDRKQKTRKVIVKGAKAIKSRMKDTSSTYDDNDVYYI
jgi:hypothetical protein